MGKYQLVKKIDVHVHTKSWGGAEIRRFSGDSHATPEQIREKYDAWGIEKGVLLPDINNECCFCPQSNEDAYRITQNYPQTFWWFMNLSPRMGNNSPTTDFSYFINHYKAMGAKGVGEMTFNLPFDHPLTDNLLRHCAECDMPVTIHIAPKKYDYYGIVDEPGLPGLEKVLKKYPELKIFGHSQPFWAEISSGYEEAERNGYPKGIKGENIPLQSRIVAICDAYDAMVGERPYRKSLSKQEALKELRRNAGTQFDPSIAQACVEAITRWDGSKVSG